MQSMHGPSICYAVPLLRLLLVAAEHLVGQVQSQNCEEEGGTQRASQLLRPRPLPRRPLPLAAVELEVIMSTILDWIRPLPRACSFFFAGASLAVNSWSALAA